MTSEESRIRQLHRLYRKRRKIDRKIEEIRWQQREAYLLKRAGEDHPRPRG